MLTVAVTQTAKAELWQPRIGNLDQEAPQGLGHWINTRTPPLPLPRFPWLPFATP